MIYRGISSSRYNNLSIIELHQFNGHDDLFTAEQSDIRAAMKIELAGLFAAQAQSQKAIGIRESNRTDRAACAAAFAIGVVEFHNPVVRIEHRDPQHLLRSQRFSLA